MSRVALTPPSVTARGEFLGRLPVSLAGRGFLLLAIGLLWLIPAWVDRSALFGLAAWDLIVLIAFVVDARQLPSPPELWIIRSWSGPLALDRDTPVDLAVHNAGDVLIHVRLMDQVAPLLRVDVPQSEVSVPPGNQGTVRYSVRPHERGDVAMGAAILQYRSGWSLVTKWALAHLEQPVRVYPDVLEARRHSLYLLRSRQAALEKRRARRTGIGREFDSLREHRDGDERRDVCWTATARRGRPITKVYQPERSQVVWILLDGGRLQRARVGGRAKHDHAVDAALALAHVAMASGDRVGLLAYGLRIQRRIGPGRGALHLRLLLESLATIRPESEEADHAGAAGALLASQKPRALVTWLSDVPETAGVPDVIETVTQLTPRHLVLFAAMRQPDLAELAARSPADSTEMYRVLAAQEVLDRRETLLHGLRQRGVLSLELSPEELASSLVERYLSVKERGLL